MAIDKELINLGLNIDQTNKIKKLNEKFTQGIDRLDKSNKEGHKTSQAMIAAAGVPMTAMKDFLDGVELKWGSVLGYLEDIGISQVQMESIRANFLE